jgi:hypothetical protein
MINVDTVKVYAPFEAIVKDWNPNKSRVKTTLNVTQNEMDHSEDIETSYQINCSGIEGITKIEYKPDRDKITIEMSSKILKGDYYKHINVNTIGQVVETINDELKGVITLDSLGLMESSYIARLDVCTDVRMKDTERKALFHGFLRNPREGFVLQPEGNNSLIINKKAKTNNCRMTIYNKFEELIKGPKKTLNIQLYKPYDHFRDVTRTELILRRRAYVRKYLKLEGYTRDIPLKAGLLSEAKPLPRYVREFAEANQNPPLFETQQERLSKCKSWEEYEKQYGIISLLEDTQYNIGVIRNLMRPYFKEKSNLYRATRKYKEIIRIERRTSKKEQTIIDRYLSQLEET